MKRETREGHGVAFPTSPPPEGNYLPDPCRQPPIARTEPQAGIKRSKHMDQVITAELRVTSLVVKSVDVGSFDEHEVLEAKATGTWTSEKGQEYPASLHITVYPGAGAIPVIGDNIKVMIAQA
jgi:hypothetical protein